MLTRKREIEQNFGNKFKCQNVKRQNVKMSNVKMSNVKRQNVKCQNVKRQFPIFRIGHSGWHAEQILNQNANRHYT